MLVEVRPLDIKKWHGKRGKDSFAQPTVIEVLYNTETGKYDTGMTPEEAAKYSVRLGGVDLSDTFRADTPHPFWSTKPAWITLPNRTIVFDTAKDADFVKVKNLKASKKVAKSQADWEAGLCPEATHVIYDEAEEVAEQATKIELENECLLLAAKMSPEDKISIVRILSKTGKSVSAMSPNFITVEIRDLIKNQPLEFKRVANLGREEVSMRAKVLELVDKNILTKEGSTYYYMSDMIGMDYESTVAWFKDPQNSKLKVMILEKLQK